MQLIIKTLLITLLGFSLSVWAEDKRNHPDIDIELLLENYKATWSIEDPAERFAVLRKIWLKNGVHESPFGRSEGIIAINQEIGGFLNQFPNAVVEFEDIRKTGNHVVCTFILRGADGTIILKGIDYFEFNHHGYLSKVVGFVE
ncbi:MAG: hypothetical protein ABW044_00635, partial [Cellvibrio sp.]